MSNLFESVADQKFHSGYQKPEDVFKHTVAEEDARKLVVGYSSILKKFYHFFPHKNSQCIDIGAGAGFITKAFNESGYPMVALEKSQDALDVFKKFNPGIQIIDGDLRSFIEPKKYDFIFSREVYLFTRVNSFSDQYQIISNMIDSLKDNGLLVLVMSQRSWPNCADLDLIHKYLKKNNKVSDIKMFSEPIINHIHFSRLNLFCYNVIDFLLRPYFYLKKKRHEWTNHYVIVYRAK